MIAILLAPILVISVLFFLRTDPLPIAVVYRQPGKWHSLKFWAFYFLMSLRKRRSRVNTNVTGKDAGYGMRSRSSVEDMDCVQQLSINHPQVLLVCFSVHPKKGGTKSMRQCACETRLTGAGEVGDAFCDTIQKSRPLWRRTISEKDKYLISFHIA